MQHLDEGTIHAWLDAALPPDEAAAADAHARSCASCAAAIAEARGLIAGAARIVSALDVSRAGVVPKIPAASAATPAAAGSIWRRLRLTPSRAALAATILVAVAGTLVVRHQRPLADTMNAAHRIDSPPLNPVVAGSLSAVAPAAPAPLKPRAPARPIQELRKTRPSADAATEPAAEPAATSSVVVDSMTPRAVAKTAAQNAQLLLDSTTAGNRAASRAAFAPSSASGARAPQSAARLEAVTAMSVTESPRCFQLGSPTADSAFALLPQRFALARANAPAPHNVLRALSAEGRVDSILAGTEWAQPTPNQVNIALSNADGVNRMVRLDLTHESATIRSARGEVQSRPIKHIDCVP